MGKLLQFSHLSDEEYLKHLYTKDDPSDEDIESAQRIELLLSAYRGMLEQIHTIANQVGNEDARLMRIRHLTGPVKVVALMQ